MSKTCKIDVLKYILIRLNARFVGIMHVFVNNIGVMFFQQCDYCEIIPFQLHTIEETNIDTVIRENGIGLMNHTSRPLNTENPQKRSQPRLKSLPQLSFDQESYNTQLSELLLREQNRTLQHIEKHFVHTDGNEDEREEWQKLARILDRIFLLLYVVCFVIITIVFVVQLNSNPNT
jgi:hypothetical protein